MIWQLLFIIYDVPGIVLSAFFHTYSGPFNSYHIVGGNGTISFVHYTNK